MKKNIFHQVDSEVYKKFKSLCAERGVAISKALEKLMVQAIKNNKKDEGKNGN